MRAPLFLPLPLVVLFAVTACVPFQSAASWRGNQGIVQGGIDPCSALTETITHGPRYLGGTVDVFRQPSIHGGPGHPSGRAIVSAHAVAHMQVKTNGMYRFVLPAGWYELRARVRYPRSSYAPFGLVKVVPHTVTHGDIPDMCI